ncbi:hypothetical protein F4680DRAFT_469712 [Xylaria scruposa]|nr:hypothetical protein F4680DRAFT_469712 [Xylaria scruposa]
MCKSFSQKGWRRTAIINVGLASACDLILLICLLISISQPAASFVQASIIFDGSCITSSTLNLFLHLLINVVSTAVLSSSNFFMQILNAPSRQEINRAHSWLQSLDIGIPSTKNLRHVSKFKSASWLIFLVTSLPIHLLFNSSVFETTYEGSQWYLTMATEAFTQAAPYFSPGASLSPAGSFGPVAHPTWTTPQFYIGGYGETVSVDQYWNATSAVRQKIASVAEESHSWVFLSAAQCQSEYTSCNPRRKYGDVVLILDSTASEGGWKRSDIFTFDPSTNLTARWDSHIPPSAVNSLWFSTQCNTTREKSSSGRDDTCTNTCLGAMGLDEYAFDISTTLLTAHEPWHISFFPAVRLHNKTLFENGLNFNDKFELLRVDHCLAEPIQPSCKVGISNVLLLIVILSILIKVIQGVIVVWQLPSASLVTPGDAIESFILYPDPVTEGPGSLDIVDSRRIEYSSLKLTTDIQPRRWKKSLRRLRHIIPYGTWIKTYSLLFAGMILLSAGFAASSESTRNNYSGSLDHSEGFLPLDGWSYHQAPGYIATALFANTPQLILSVCYFSYNSLLTQFNVEKEWNAFSISYQPLRVSYPAGQQVSSYRLQLPYRHSMPLILVSIALHWVLSNAVFLYVNEGGYWDQRSGFYNFEGFGSASERSVIAVGFSPLLFLVLFIASFLLIVLPPVLLSFYKMKGHMVTGGWNSLVVSAACHVPIPENDQNEQFFSDETGSTQTRHTEVIITTDEDGVYHNKLVDLSQRKLRWGVTELPGKLAGSISSEGRAVFHLGFGGEEHNISEPKIDQYCL